MLPALGIPEPQRLLYVGPFHTDSFQERNEARLFEVVVGGERITNTQLAQELPQLRGRVISKWLTRTTLD